MNSLHFQLISVRKPSNLAVAETFKDWIDVSEKGPFVRRYHLDGLEWRNAYLA
jgi:hypothetical protein